MDFKMDVKILEKTLLRVFLFCTQVYTLDVVFGDLRKILKNNHPINDSDGLLTEIQLVTTQKYDDLNVFVIANFWMAYMYYMRGYKSKYCDLFGPNLKCLSV
jgi:hypothetical protein